jgi:hypothetical protein
MRNIPAIAGGILEFGAEARRVDQCGSEALQEAKAMKAENETYLGDAVYVSHDGYQLCLRTGDSNNQRIYLEPAVYRALVDYAKRRSL